MDNPECGTQGPVDVASASMFSLIFLWPLSCAGHSSQREHLLPSVCLCSFCRLDLGFFSFLCLSIFHSLIRIQYQLLSRASPSPPGPTVFPPHVARLPGPRWPCPELHRYLRQGKPPHPFRCPGTADTP